MEEAGEVEGGGEAGVEEVLEEGEGEVEGGGSRYEVWTGCQVVDAICQTGHTMLAASEESSIGS